MIIIILLFIVGSYGSTVMDYAAAEDVVISTTTEMTTVLNHTCTTINEVQYLVQWTAELNINSTSARIGVCLVLDGITTFNEQAWRPDKSCTDSWLVATGFAVLPISAGNHHFTISFAPSIEGEIARIRRTRLLIEEIEL